MSDTYCPQDIDAFVAMVRILPHAGATDLRMWPVDFPIAYKTNALHMDSRDAAHICFSHHVTNKPYDAEILVRPFGIMRAPANWGRAFTFAQFLTSELLALVVGACVDDVFCAEPACVVKSCFRAFKQLCRIIGFATSTKQDQPPSTQMLLLGADVALGNEFIWASARSGRVGEIRPNIAQALQLNHLSPAAECALRGNLCFPTSLLSGKVGRGRLGL